MANFEHLFVKPLRQGLEKAGKWLFLLGASLFLVAFFVLSFPKLVAALIASVLIFAGSVVFYYSWKIYRVAQPSEKAPFSSEQDVESDEEILEIVDGEFRDIP